MDFKKLRGDSLSFVLFLGYERQAEKKQARRGGGHAVEVVRRRRRHEVEGEDLSFLFAGVLYLHCEGSGKLNRARSRLYRGQILQENMRLKALAEIYTMHSFAQLCNLIFVKILQNSV